VDEQAKDYCRCDLPQDPICIVTTSRGRVAEEHLTEEIGLGANAHLNILSELFRAAEQGMRVFLGAVGQVESQWGAERDQGEGELESEDVPNDGDG